MRTATVDGAALLAAREKKRLTLAELAERAEQAGYAVSVSMLSRIESGDRQPGAKLFDAIVDALGVEASTLLIEEAA